MTKIWLNWPEPALLEKQPDAEPVEGAAGGGEGTAKAGG